MRISKQLIAKYLPQILEIEDKIFIDVCSAIGIEVEKVINHPFTKNIVVGQIISIVQHPNADKLSVCKVNVGSSLPTLTIVCGARNIKANNKVIVALESCMLYNDKKIVKTKIRDVESEGMLCAYPELTPHNHEYLSSQDINGVIILDDNAIIGDTNPLKYIGLDDTIYELTLPSNRNDLNGVISFCQDFAAYMNLPFVWPEINIDKGSFANTLKINFDQRTCKGCRFLQIKNINNSPTPWLIKKNLINNGCKPVESIVDYFSFISLLTNVPLAIYDTNKLLGEEINICLSSTPINFIGFNDKQHQTNASDIVVLNENKILGLAGILGNKEYGVDEKTKNITIEIANFSFTNIRQTSLRLNINTNASKSNSRDISPYFIDLTATLIYNILKDYEISNLAGDVNLPSPIAIEIDTKFISSIIGMNISNQHLEQFLTRFGFIFKNEVCYVPLHRIDITNNQDLAEELLKLMNINDIAAAPIIANVENNQTNIEYELINKISNWLVANGFYEVKTYNLISQNRIEKFNIYRYSNYVKISNVNNQQREYMRTNLIDRLLDVYANNNKRKNQLLPIFEIQDIYTNAIEKNVTLLAYDGLLIDPLSKSKIHYNVNYLKMITNKIANILNAKITYQPINDNNFFYPNETVCVVYNGETIGYIGLIKKSQLGDYDLKNKNVYCLSINITRMLTNYINDKFAYEQPSNLMPIIKDISFLVPNRFRLNDMIVAIKNLSFIQSTYFVDQYEIDNDNKSYTLRIIFKNNKILTSEEITSYLKQIERVVTEHHVIIRK